MTMYISIQVHVAIVFFNLCSLVYELKTLNTNGWTLQVLTNWRIIGLYYFLTDQLLHNTILHNCTLRQRKRKLQPLLPPLMRPLLRPLLPSLLRPLL